MYGSNTLPTNSPMLPVDMIHSGRRSDIFNVNKLANAHKPLNSFGHGTDKLARTAADYIVFTKVPKLTAAIVIGAIFAVFSPLMNW